MKKTLTIIIVTLLVCGGIILFKFASFNKSDTDTVNTDVKTPTVNVREKTAAPTKTISRDLNISCNLNVTNAPEVRWKTYTNTTYGFSVGYPYGTTILENGVAGADVNFNDGNVEVLIAGGSSYCKESLNASEGGKVGTRTFRVSRTPFTAYYYYQYSSTRCFRFIFRQLGKDAEKVNSLVDNYLTTFKVTSAK